MDANELALINSTIEVKRSEIKYFTAVQGISNDVLDVLNNEDNIDRLIHEIEYLEALKEGPVVLMSNGKMKGFSDLKTAMAYLEAENVAAGKDPRGKILIVGPESQKAIEKLIEEEGGYA